MKVNESKPLQMTKPSGTISLQFDWKSILWLLLFSFIILTRFHHLGDKPFHHDESLYAKYIWNFFTGSGYKYDPMQHGPFLFHFSQLTLFMFGVTNFTIRILPAATGLFLTFFLFMIRKRLPGNTALIGAWIFGINAVFMYFQRFLRHDPFFALFAILTAFFFYMWYQDRKPWQIYSASAALSSLVCIKENAFVQALIMFTFVFVYLFAKMIEKNQEGKRGGLKSVVDAMYRFPMTTKIMVATIYWGLSFVFYAAGYMFFKAEFSNWEKLVQNYWLVIFGLFFFLVIGLVYLSEQRRGGKSEKKFLGLKPEFYNDSYIFALTAFVFVGIFVLLFTTVFSNMDGFWGGVYKWFVYWEHQHSIQRIAGPFHYYHHQMLIYAFLPFAVVIAGFLSRAFIRTPMFTSAYIGVFIVIFYVFNNVLNPIPHITSNNLFTNAHIALALGVFIAGFLMVISYIREKSFLKAFLLWWTIFAYIVYSYLQEKVPWLTMHIITPMILLSAVYLSELFADSTKKLRRNVVIGFCSIMVIYSIHTSFQLCWYHEADPTEQMVYVQTTYEVPKIVEELEEMTFWENEKQNLPIVITGHATWPFYWYLRDWKGVSYGSHVDPNRHLVVICNWEDRHKFAEKLGDGYVARKYGLRAWYLPKFTDLKKNKRIIRDAWRWVAYRERFQPNLYGIQGICMFVRNDMAKYSKGIDLGDKPKPPQAKPAPSSAAKVPKNITQFGGFGVRDGLFNTPKDVAVDRQGNVFVVDSKNSRVQKFDAAGKFVKTWGTFGKGDSQFEKPTGIGVDHQGNVYVADTWNHRIQKFNNDGTFIMKFGDDKIFWAPKDVVIDTDGHIFVVNTGFHRFQKFSKNGGEIWAVGQKGESATQFTEPVGIDVDSKGQVYIADTANHRVSVFDKDGHPLRQFQVFGWEDYYTEPYIAVDDEKNQIYLTDSKQNRIMIFDLKGKFKNFWGVEGSGNGQFKAPLGVALANGKVYVSESENHRIQVFDQTQL